MKIFLLFFLLVSWPALARSLPPIDVTMPEVGIDCTGHTDSTVALQAAINNMAPDSSLKAPSGCKIAVSSTIHIQGKVGLQIISEQRAVNCAGSAPSFVWTGAGPGPVLSFVDDDHPTLQGFYFSTPTINTLNSVLSVDGNGSGGHTPTLALVKYNSFCFYNQSNPNLKLLSISPTSNSNNENYTIEENLFYCSSHSTVRRAVDGVTNGTATITSATTNFTSADVGKRIRVSYANGMLDSTITSVRDSTTVTVAASQWSPTSIYASGNPAIGSDGALYVSLLDDNHGQDPTSPASIFWASMWSTSGATVHTDQAYGIGVYQSGSNSFHERYRGNQFAQCATGMYITSGGSYSIEHYAGYSNDIGLRLISTRGTVENYDAEHELQAIVGGSTVPLLVRAMRGTVDNSVANGWIFFPTHANFSIEGFALESTPPANWVLFGGAARTSYANIVSQNNFYNLLFSQVNLCFGWFASFTNDTFDNQTNVWSGYCGAMGLPKSPTSLPPGVIWNNRGLVTVH